MERGGNEELLHRLNEGNKVLGGLWEIWKRENLAIGLKVRLLESIFVPTVLYGCGVWVWNEKVRKRLDVIEMKALRMICGVSRRDRVRNVRIREICGWNRSLVERCQQGILKWFGHIVRMGEDRLVKKLFESKVGGNMGRGRPKGRWMDGWGEEAG